MHQTALNVEEIFLEALEIKNPEARSIYLSKTCGDTAIRHQVERLLALDAQASGFLESPVSLSMIPEAASWSTEGPGSFIGAYRLMEQIGEGGMGVVYVAEQSDPVRRQVALKLIKPGMDTKQVIARFEAERQALAMMDHPNIAKVHDGGTSDSGRPYFVMELVRGVPITDYCDDQRLSIRERLELFVLVCRAVQHAHQKGVIHRDLKPSNILVTQHDGVPVPKVIDFGIAKATGQSLTEKTVYTAFAQLIGTPLYMSPEQVEMSGLDVDTRSDIYSLGVLLYELLTGTTPFDSETLKQAAFDEVRRMIREVEPPAPSSRFSSLGATLTATSSKRSADPRQLNRSIRGELDWIAMKALEKDRTRRYETANDFAADVVSYLADQPVRACPPSSGYRLRKFARRNRAAISTAALLATALGLGTVISTWQAILARRSERDAIAAWAAESHQRKRAVEAEALAQNREQRVAEEAERARRSEEDTKAFSTFLVDDFLAVAGPKGLHGGLGVAVTMAEAIESAEAKLPERFEGRPLAEATARHALGQTWRNLAQYEKAEMHSRRALELQESMLGPDELPTLESRNLLATVLFLRGRHADAIALHEENLKKLLAKFGTDSVHTLTCMNNLAAAYIGDGQVLQAEPLYKSVLEVSQRVLGEEKIEALNALHGLAKLHKERGEYSLALPLFERVLEVGRLVQGNDHVDTITSMRSLADLYEAQGESQKAHPLLVEALEVGRRVHGVENPTVLETINSLASYHVDQGHYFKAEPLFLEALEVSCRVLGEDNPSTIMYMNNLAILYKFMNQLDRSTPLLERVLKSSQVRLGRDHPSTLLHMANLGLNLREGGRKQEGTSMLEEAWKLAQNRPGPLQDDITWIPFALADAYDQDGRFKDSEPIYRELLEEAPVRDGGDSPLVADALAALGQSYFKQGDYASAEPLLRECLELREQISPDEWRTFKTRSLLGGSLLGLENYAEAEPLLVTGYEGLKQREEQIPPPVRSAVREALSRVVQLYEAWEKEDEAARWREKAEVENPPNLNEPG